VRIAASRTWRPVPSRRRLLPGSNSWFVSELADAVGTRRWLLRQYAPLPNGTDGLTMARGAVLSVFSLNRPCWRSRQITASVSPAPSVGYRCSQTDTVIPPRKATGTERWARLPATSGVAEKLGMLRQSNVHQRTCLPLRHPGTHQFDAWDGTQARRSDLPAPGDNWREIQTWPAVVPERLLHHGGAHITGAEHNTPVPERRWKR
jgi:hypothetical protein